MQAELMDSQPADMQVRLLSAQALHALLDSNLGLPPEYRNGLTNHLPMALQALQAMGAGPQRMKEFYARYSQRFEDRQTAAPAAPRSDWRVLRGKGDEQSFAALAATFEQAIAQEGPSSLLRRVLPDLLPGVATGAFHGVIRTAHALQSGHRSELARALAYWAWRWQDLALPDPVDDCLSFDRWWAHLAREAANERFVAPLISSRIAMATCSPAYRSLGAALALPQPELLKRLSALALSTYLASKNFTVLHMITGLRAVRVLLPWLGDGQALQPLLMRAFTAAFLAAQVKPLDPRPVLPTQRWPDVIAVAIASDDDHVIKLVHACQEEFAAYRDPRYLEAASLAVN